MPPAARIGDMHTCPLSDGPKPHGGGPIMPMPPGPHLQVLIDGQPAAVVGTMCTCVGPPDTIDPSSGSKTVFIGNKAAARMGDMTLHKGVIVQGSPTVIIGG